MPSTSAKRLLRAPLGTETPDVPRDIIALVADLEAEVGILATRSVLDVGLVGNTRAGRVLTPADFTDLGLSAPIGLWNLSSLVNEGSIGGAGTLVNKGAIPFGTGITGAAAEAAIFAGSTAQAFYIADTGAADSFRIKTGSWGCWFKTAKRGIDQQLVSKMSAASGNWGWVLRIRSDNTTQAEVYPQGTSTGSLGLPSVTDVCDDRWHFAVTTFDGSVLRLHIDGALESSAAVNGALFASAGPFNIGAANADSSTVSASPMFGRIDEAFVTADVLSEEQVRLLMAIKLAHGAGRAPRSVRANLRRRKRSPLLVPADFPTAPLRLYNLDDLTDDGTNAVALTEVGSPTRVAGPDGKPLGAYQFDGVDDYLNSTDAGLPTGTAARSMGAWFKTSQGSGEIIAYGTTVGDGSFNLGVSAAGVINIDTWSTSHATGPIVTDGQHHFGVATYEPTPTDGLKFKLYLDGKLVGSGVGTAINTVLAGAGAFTVGRYNNGTANFFKGSISRGFVTSYVLTPEQVAALYAKGSDLVGSSTTGLITPYSEADMREIIQGMDETSLWILGDARKQISGRINADGTVAEAVGGDFRVVRTQAGVYAIYWPPRFFSAPPVITAWPNSANGSQLVATGNSNDAMRATVQVVNAGAAWALADSQTFFTAEGRGPIPSQHQLDLAVAA